MIKRFSFRVLRPALCLFCFLGLLSGCGLSGLKKDVDVQANLEEASRRAQVDAADAQARHFVDLALAVDPADAGIYISPPNPKAPVDFGNRSIAGVFLSVGDDPALADYMQQAIQKFPNDPRIDAAYQLLADAQGRLGRTKDQKATAATLATHLHKELLSAGATEMAGLKCSEAQADWDSGNPALGALEYRQAMVAYPKDSAPSNGLAYAYAVANDPAHLPEALTLAQQSLRMTQAQVAGSKDLPENIGAVQGTLGWVQYRLGRFKDAEASLQQAVNAAPRRAELRYHLGMTYLTEGNVEAARTELMRATLLSKGYAAAQSELDRLPKATPPAPSDNALPPLPL